MSTIVRFVVVMAVLCFAADASAHGWLLIPTVDVNNHPLSLSAVSQSQVLDNSNTASANSSLFWDKFAISPTSGFYAANGGGPQTAGPFLAYDSATFQMLSPLYFSDGTGAAVRASTGTYVNIFSNTANGGDGVSNLQFDGSTGLLNGFNVSLTNTHELQKQLFLAAGSTQTYGEYGYTFDLTVNFHDGTTLTTLPLVDVFALRDPNLPGGSFITAPLAQQDAATNSLLAAAVPEPSGLSLAGLSLALLGVLLWRSRRSG